MDELHIDGHWSIPGSNSQAVGVLTGGTAGLGLELEAPLIEAPSDQDDGAIPEWTVTPVVHGVARDGREVTLFGVGGANRIGGTHRGEHGFYHPQFAVLGGLLDDSRVVGGRFSFDQLVAWAEPPPMVDHSGSSDGFTVEVGVDSIGSAVLDGVKVDLLYGVEGTWGDAVHLDRWVAVDVSYQDPVELTDFIGGAVRSAQNLLSVMTGVSVRLTLLVVRAPGRGDREDPLSVHFAPNQADESAAASRTSMASYTAPTLLMRRGLLEHVSFDAVVRRWLELDTELDTAITQLLAPQYSTSMYSDHRFTTAFAAAENYAKRRYRTTETDPALLHSRVRSILDAPRAAQVDDDTLDWALNRLGRNDRRLAGLVSDLIENAGVAGQALLSADRNIAGKFAGVRGPVAHGGSKTTGAMLHWYSEALRWLVRGHLAVELGVPASLVWERVGSRVLFRRACRELAEAADR